MINCQSLISAKSYHSLKCLSAHEGLVTHAQKVQIVVGHLLFCLKILRLSERFLHFIMRCVRKTKDIRTVTERRYFLISSLFALHCKNLAGEKSSTYLFPDLVLSPIFEHHVCKQLTTHNSLQTSVTWSTSPCSNRASSWIFVTFRRHDTTLTNATKV